MGKSSLLVAIWIASCPLAMAAPPAQHLTYQRLNDQDALDNLLRTNPRHYAIARRILASANELCAVGKGTPVPAKFEAKYITCTGGFWLASNPPKHELAFQIDETVYSALVAVTLRTRVEPIPRLEVDPYGSPNGYGELVPVR